MGKCLLDMLGGLQTFTLASEFGIYGGVQPNQHACMLFYFAV